MSETSPQIQLARGLESAMARKSWREKLADNKDFPKIVPLTGGMKEQWGEGTVVIVRPMEIDELMRKVRKGKLATINEIREFLAKKHGATITCPMTAGIFARTAAEVAHEDERDGKKRITPYWRILKAGGELNPKYPGGIDNLKTRLEAEGHTVIQKGKRFLVEDFDKSLMRF